MTETPDKSSQMCPSARCETGAVLIGMVRQDSTVGHIPQRMEIDEDFVKTANADGLAETRFRFASPCVKSGCAQWKNNQCGVVEKAAHDLENMQTDILPRCSIRKDCRWFRQRAAAACRVCSFVVTDDAEASANYAKHLIAER